MYHCTVPTDALLQFNSNIIETIDYGLDRCEQNAIELGNEMRNMLENKGFEATVSEHYKSPTVIVSYCKNNMVKPFLEQGIQVAGFVPFMIGESSEINTFRIGLFGLDKLKDTKNTLDLFYNVLKNIK